MTTAHRATWKAARGGLQEDGSFRLHVPSAAVSAKDAPTERTLKTRTDGQAQSSRAELREALESGERRAAYPAKRRRFEPPTIQGLGLKPEVPEALRISSGHGLSSLDADAVLDDEVDGVDATAREHGSPGGGNEGHMDGTGGEELEDVESDYEDSEDDEAELLAELERIKKEREFEKAKKNAEEQERLEQEATEKAAAGNPLLNLSVFQDEISDTASVATSSMPAFAVKRRWDDDVIFRSQSRKEEKGTPRFINDTIRNDFHRRFMRKYVR